MAGMTEEKIKRINELAKKVKDGTITPEEADERKSLHREYIDSIKHSLRHKLESIEFVDDDKNHN